MEIKKNKFIQNLFSFQRRFTKEVTVGNIKIGGNNPVCIQSMTSTNTLKTDETVAQSLRIIRAGGELVRITAQGVREAKNLEFIKNGIRDADFYTPLAADIHFNPKAALTAAKLVEKVRINPGNFVDKRANFSKVDFSETEYKAEIKKIEEKLVPLLEICKQHKTALRIGVNHGSLSDRIMSRYGDTPEGMVESAMEFLRIAVHHDFQNIILSLKSSNIRVMVQANRLMITRMEKENMNFPLHLGVTEAGEGEDGRIKSAVGIGALLADGIGDTIRVSLTEPPEDEIPVAQKLAGYFTEREHYSPIEPVFPVPIDFFDYQKYTTDSVKNIGGNNVPVVIAKDLNKSDLQPDYIYWGDRLAGKTLNVKNNYIVDESVWMKQEFNTNHVFPLFKSINNYFVSDKKSNHLNFIIVKNNELEVEGLQKINYQKNIVLVLTTCNLNGYADQRAAFFKLINAQCKVPVIIRRSYSENNVEDFQLKSASDIGGLFLDGMGDGVWIENKGEILHQDLIHTAFGILQASRVRISKTEYISCPGCGRTLFDLQKTTKVIRERTSHLKNLKIGIMGCIVNGPGEMADADYGYVGAGPGKITLYKNKEIIKKNIPEEKAVDELIQLIKDCGDWVDLF
ncbi:MAG: (E)-4-hydroxy-3-methylbut-2-enyl-diphosphate synthase [Bacteroidota bacterium]|nr:(E)-4-hydroxy-3-methylbut-2-enyl-diphosphate synthase [Bacteroidota bacterium]